jgi:hypothetical protein
VRSLSTLSGEVMYYPNFAVEIVNGLASALLFFGEIHTH